MVILCNFTLTFVFTLSYYLLLYALFEFHPCILSPLKTWLRKKNVNIFNAVKFRKRSLTTFLLRWRRKYCTFPVLRVGKILCNEICLQSSCLKQLKIEIIFLSRYLLYWLIYVAYMLRLHICIFRKTSDYQNRYFYLLGNNSNNLKYTNRSPFMNSRLLHEPITNPLL